jgi:hypothetical protein
MIRALAGGLVGFILSRILSFAVPANAHLFFSFLCLFIGGLVGGWFSRKYGWVAGLITGSVDAVVNLAVLIAIGASVGMSSAKIYSLLLPSAGNFLLALLVGAVAGFLGGKLRGS